MISRIEALNFRCLRAVAQSLGPFHVLVGPNASGKTTFLDAVAFLGKLVSDGLETALDERTRNFQDLVWGRRGRGFELALEFAVPEPLRPPRTRGGPELDTIRYEVALEIDRETRQVGFRSESVRLKTKSLHHFTPRPSTDGGAGSRRFSALDPSSETLISPRGPSPRWRRVLQKDSDGRDRFFSEAGSSIGRRSWLPSFKLGPRRSALGNLPEDESQFPAATWMKNRLAKGVQQLALNSARLRQASPPGKAPTLESDGSNLPWIIADLTRRSPERLQGWIEHLRTALPDLEGIRAVERADDRHCYLMLRYRGGLEVPSWMASDGSLRLLALTLPAYLPDFAGIYLIEEPENGIHPRAVETLFQSLSSVYDAQILLATHSPVVLSIVDPKQLLCFTKTADGATEIVPGDEHPALREWRGETNLGVLFASGVLG